MAVQVGQQGINFQNLKGTDGKSHSLEDYASFPILVVIFSCNHCPYVKAYENRYIQIQKDYESKGVRLIAINANDVVNYPDDSFDNMVRRVKEKQYNFPYLFDEDQSVARAFGATNTPHVFVFDQSRALRYTGRIDNNWEHAEKVSSHDLKNALDDLLAGKDIATSSTLPVGCSVKWKK